MSDDGSGRPPQIPMVQPTEHLKAHNLARLPLPHLPRHMAVHAHAEPFASSQNRPQLTVAVVQPRALTAALEHLDLVTQGEVLEHQGPAALEAGQEGVYNQGKHRVCPMVGGRESVAGGRRMGFLIPTTI
jgi:hypothetical protein